MGEEPGRVEKSPPRAVRRLESDIERTRRVLADYVEELDRRRHRLTGRGPVAIAAAAAALVVLGIGAAVVLRRRSRRAPSAQAKMLLEAARRFSRHPERVARENGALRKAALSLVPIVAKAVLSRGGHANGRRERRQRR